MREKQEKMYYKSCRDVERGGISFFEQEESERRKGSLFKEEVKGNQFKVSWP